VDVAADEPLVGVDASILKGGPGSPGTVRRRCRFADPGAFIANRDLFSDLPGNERFAAAYRAALASLHQHGARSTLEPLLFR
jgi:mannitol-1-phosphate/altronate dehydrogenase